MELLVATELECGGSFASLIRTFPLLQSRRAGTYLCLRAGEGHPLLCTCWSDSRRHRESVGETGPSWDLFSVSLLNALSLMMVLTINVVCIGIHDVQALKAKLEQL